jgi:menaquinone-dependent protoporphyrinogen oxidase
MIGVFYSSKYGTTEKAVKVLEESLKVNGYSVEVYNIKEDKPTLDNLKTFELILVGGSIYMGKIQKEVIKFCEGNKEILLNNPLGLFLCCGSEDDFESQLTNNFSTEIVNQASVKGYFGYGYNLEKMNFIYRKIIKKVANISSSESAINNESIDTFAKKATKLIST